MVSMLSAKSSKANSGVVYKMTGSLHQVAQWGCHTQSRMRGLWMHKGSFLIELNSTGLMLWGLMECT